MLNQNRTASSLAAVRRPSKLILAAICFACYFGIAPLNAQQPPREAAQPIPVEPKTEELKQAIQDMRDHLKEMRAVMIRYHMSQEFETAGYKAKWAKLQQAGIPIHQAMLQAGLKEYKQNLESKELIGQWLFKILDRNLDDDRFEGMLDIALGLQQGQYPDPNIHGHVTFAALASNQWDLFNENLNYLLQIGDVAPLMKDFQENLDEVKALWQRELELREQDAAGPPLPKAIIHTTKGDLEIELFENQAPATVANFISLAEQGFYDDRAIYQVISHFSAQMGCPNDDGTGTADYFIPGENENRDARGFFRGVLGMSLMTPGALKDANPDSGSCQFFITLMPNLEMNERFTAFGRVTKGIEILANFNRVDPTAEKDKDDPKPKKEPDRVTEIEIVSKRDHTYEPTKLEN